MPRTLPSFVIKLSAAAWLLSVAPLARVVEAQASPPPPRADTVVISLPDVRRLAVDRDPTLLSVRQYSAIARGAWRQSRLVRANPDLALQSTGGALGSPSGQLELTLTQEVEWAGQRGLRAAAARTFVARSDLAVQDAGRSTVADAFVGFYRAFAAERRWAVAEEASSLIERLLAAVRTQVREGEISVLEANLAEIEAGRARGRVLSARRAATSAQQELKLRVGLASDRPVRLQSDSAVVRTAPPTEATVDSLIEVALARRPDLVGAEEAVREAETLAALARREAVPSLRIGAAATSQPGSSSLQLGPAIGFTLPFLNRNQGLADERRARLAQARLGHRAVLLRVRTDVRTAAEAYRTATEEATVYETSVLQRAHENAALLETAYGAGKIGLSTLLLLRNQLLDAELSYWDAWLAQREALVQLEAATGQLTPTSSELAPVDPAAVRRRDSLPSFVRTIP